MISAPGNRPLRVFVVDDSASFRAAFAGLISKDPGLELMGTAGDPFAAVEKLRNEMPDVLLLDLEMPKMDGLTFLRKIMARRPIPVVVCSSYTEAGSNAMFEALESGAAEVLAKPRFDNPEARREAAMLLGDALRAAAAARRPMRRRKLQPAALPKLEGGKLSPDVILPPRPGARIGASDRPPVIVIGASTGGPEALRRVLTALPADAPGIAIVQHMPEHFTGAFARRLDGLCRMSVCEAQDGQALRRGQVLIAPGDHHMLLRADADGYSVSVVDGPCVSRHRPSVDVLFRSAAQEAGANALGILMTGMGDDGAACLGELRAAGGQTIAQDEASCVVYGMPREAVTLGHAGRILALDELAAEIQRWNPGRRPLAARPAR